MTAFISLCGRMFESWNVFCCQVVNVVTKPQKKQTALFILLFPPSASLYLLLLKRWNEGEKCLQLLISTPLNLNSTSAAPVRCGCEHKQQVCRRTPTQSTQLCCRVRAGLCVLFIVSLVNASSLRPPCVLQWGVHELQMWTLSPTVCHSIIASPRPPPQTHRSSVSSPDAWTVCVDMAKSEVHICFCAAYRACFSPSGWKYRTVNAPEKTNPPWRHTVCHHKREIWQNYCTDSLLEEDSVS